MPRTLLEQGDRHILDCMRRIEEQRRRIFELERLGEDTTASTKLLAALIHFHAIAELRRDTLLRLSVLERERKNQIRQ